MHIDKFAMNLKSGDITLPDGTKANVYTNTGPIVTYYKKVEELGYDAAVSGAASATGSAAADGVKASGSVVPASAASTALNGTSSAAPSASTVVEADSAAGKMAVGGWVAAVAVIAMVVV